MRGSRSHRWSRRRRGFNLIVLLFLLLVFAGVGIYLMSLAQHSGRSSHWFQDAQVAFRIADAAVKETGFWLEQANSLPLVRAVPRLDGALEKVWDALGEGGPSPAIMLFSSSDPGGIPGGVERVLQEAEDLSPTLEVSLRVVESSPLWTGSPVGVPSDPRERRGRIRIVAEASVRRRIGMRVSRSITIERNFKRVSLLPPVLGRFVLFVRSNDASEDPNFVRSRFEPGGGDATPDPGGPRPLMVRSGAAAPMVEGHHLRRESARESFTGETFLDRQGWIYLGGPAAWDLRLAHGWGEHGESFLLPTYRRLADSQDEFQERFSDATRSSFIWCSFDSTSGLGYYYHGFADGYPRIGIPAGLHGTLEGKLDLGPAHSSGLRLFGSPGAVSPTIVFGPVNSVFVRRADVEALTERLTAGGTLKTVRMILNLLRFEDHSQPEQRLLSYSFGSEEDYRRRGPGEVKQSYLYHLDLLLGPWARSGQYDSTGLLRGSDIPVVGPYRSGLIGPLDPLPARDWASERIPDLDPPGSGSLELEGCFEGRLEEGLEAFRWAVTEPAQKLTFLLQRRSLGGLVAGRVLEIPGIVLVEESELEIGPIDRVDRGGILICEGPIHIKGSVRRGIPARSFPSALPPPAVPEPLTLVSLGGDITVDPGVEEIESFLVAPRGRVIFGRRGLVIRGGVACDRLDLSSLKSHPADRQLIYAQDMDPRSETNVEPSAAVLRVFFGDPARISVAGEAGES